MTILDHVFLTSENFIPSFIYQKTFPEKSLFSLGNYPECNRTIVGLHSFWKVQ